MSLRVPNAKVEGVDLFPEKEWGLSTTEKLGLHLASRGGAAPIVVDRPFVFVTASERSRVEGIGPEALRLVGTSWNTFLDVIERSLRAVRREKAVLETSASVAMWLAARMLVNPNFVVGLRSAREEVVALFRMLRAFDPGHFGGCLVENEDGSRSFELAFQDGRLLIFNRPIDRLASGYAALLQIFQEIVSSIAAWETMRGQTDLFATDALIFIDEIDAHLHPRWQRALLPFLKRTFPNATFVVTTHAPLIVRDTEPGEAYELVRTGDHVTTRRLGSPKDWYLADLLSDAFHVDLPAPGTEAGDEPPLVDALLSFARQVQEYAASPSPELRETALRDHAALVQRMPADDPRARSLAELRGLLG
jgi:hypothetical protein